METVIRCEGVLFDLDGTLVDSTPIVERIWGAWAARRGIDLQSLLAVSHGRRTFETIRLVAPHLPDPAGEAAALEALEETDTTGVCAIAGALELLDSLPVDRWGIVTSCPRELAIRRLGAAGFRIPKVMVTADDVTQGKPDPQPYLLGAAALGLGSAECLAFEDAPAGIDSAIAAGMKVVALATTYAPGRLNGHWQITDLTGARLLPQRAGDGLSLNLKLAAA